jgi:hypothetical protein
MMLTKAKPYNSRKKADVRRREFISTGIFGGLTLALTPGLESLAYGADNEAPSLLPSPADSLSLYMILLDRLKSKILNPYFDLLNCLSSDITSRYAQLKKDVAELELLVPELRSRTETSNLRSVSEVGYASGSLVGTLAAERVLLTNASFTLASLGPEGLRNTASELQRQRGSLTLSPRAANLLRKILDEIRDLEKPSEGLGKTAEILTDLNDGLDGSGGRMAAIRLNLMSAITSLVADELSTGSGSTARQNAARDHVLAAISQLQELDSYKPPQSLQSYVANSRSNRCQEARNEATVAGMPTQTLRDLLAGTVKWIEMGGQISQHSRGEVQYVKASTRTSMTPDWFGRWYSVRQVLNDDLPPASKGRTFICLGLIGPILMGYNADRRVNMIYDQLTNLIPGGASDRDETRRRRASHRLAVL